MELTRRLLLRNAAAGSALTLAGGLRGTLARAATDDGVDLSLLPSRRALWRWTEEMVALGPRLTGNRAHLRFIDSLEGRLRDAGLRVQRDPYTFRRWDARRWSLELLGPGGPKRVPLASYYPYSGSTPPQGFEAEFIDVGAATPETIAGATELDGKIVLVDAPLPPLSLGFFYPSFWYFHDPDGESSPLDDYRRVWTYALTLPHMLDALQARGAKGAVFILDASSANAADQYTPHGQLLGSLPAVHVDRETGAALRAALRKRASSQPRARLKLDAPVDPKARVDALIATLPGQISGEPIIIANHTDGQNGVEENGNLGMVALARYFAALPRSARRRPLVFVFSPGHMTAEVPGVDGFVERHPNIVENAVAGIVPEHLGTREWLDDANGYHASGKLEFYAAFCSNSPIVTPVIDAVRAEDLRRTGVLRPLKGNSFFGEGTHLHEAGVPTVGYLSGPNYLLQIADGGHLDKLDPKRMHADVRFFARLIHAFDAMPAELLKAGDPALLGAAHPPPG